MKKPKLTPIKLTEVDLQVGDEVVVEWLDAHNLEDGWTDVRDIRFRRCEIKTLGHFVALAEDQIWLAADFSPKDQQVNTVVGIPTGWLIAVRKLNNG